MRVALVLEGMPHRGTSGGAIAMWSLLERLRELGHDVTAVVLVSYWDRELGAAAVDERRRQVEGLGVTVQLLTTPDRHPAPQGRLEAFFPHAALAPEVAAALGELRPQVVLGFDTGILLALRGYDGASVLGIPGDPRHLVWRHQLRSVQGRERFRRGHLRERLRFLRDARAIERELVALARGPDSVAMFGAQHAAWLTAQGVPCLYLPIPVADAYARVAAIEPARPPRILLLGGLATTATRLGLDAVVQSILPRLPAGAELHLAGSGTLPGRFAQLAADPRVRLRGFVDDSAVEIAESTAFLVPADYPVGARTRIVEALSLGAAVVAHVSARAGIPELEDGENALLGADGNALAAALERLLADPALAARIRAGARATYERQFRPEVACDALVGELERLAAPYI